MIAFECWTGEAVAALIDAARRYGLTPESVEGIAVEATYQARQSRGDHTVTPTHVATAARIYLGIPAATGEAVRP